MIFTNSNLIEKNIFDVVIVGSGAAGITLALEFEKKQIKVALIEAGQRNYSNESQSNYKGEIEGLFPRDPDISRLRMFGGTTGHWGGTCRTLDEYDFNKWPINKNNLNTYLSDSTKILKIKNSFKNESINSNLNLIEFQVSNVKFGNVFYEKIKKSKFIHLFLNCPVIEIIGDNFIVSKVKCFSETDKKEFNLWGKVFVLATGGIENSRMLLIEKMKKKNLFNHNLPIGNYWYEHPFMELGKAIVNKEKLKNKLNTSLNHFVNMFNAGDNSDAYSFAPTSKLMKEKKILNSCCWLVTHDRSNKGWKNIAKNLLCEAPNLSNKFLKFINRSVSCGATIYSSWEQDPEFSNKVVLSDKKDKFGNPRPKLIYKKSELVRRTARTVFEEIGYYLIKNDLGRVVGNSFLFESNVDYISEAGWHHMGGTIMGDYNKNSVVDENLKIHGSKNLFVLGSSSFPSCGHANPTLTIMQLTFRLNEHLLKNYFKQKV